MDTTRETATNQMHQLTDVCSYDDRITFLGNILDVEQSLFEELGMVDQPRLSLLVETTDTHTHTEINSRTYYTRTVHIKFLYMQLHNYILVVSKRRLTKPSHLARR